MQQHHAALPILAQAALAVVHTIAIRVACVAAPVAVRQFVLPVPAAPAAVAALAVRLPIIEAVRLPVVMIVAQVVPPVLIITITAARVLLPAIHPEAVAVPVVAVILLAVAAEALHAPVAEVAALPAEAVAEDDKISVRR